MEILQLREAQENAADAAGKGGKRMKGQFYLGVGLGTVAALSALMLMEPKKTPQQLMDEACKTVDKAMDKVGM